MRIVSFMLCIFSASFCVAEEDYRAYGPFFHSDELPSALFFFSEVESGDSWFLRKALRNHEEVNTIVMSSPGGNVADGLLMAGIIHDKGLRTYIPQKDFYSEEGICYSACSYMFLAGKDRIADGKLGVHQFKSENENEKQKVGTAQEGTQYVVSEIIGFLNEFETPPFVYERMFEDDEMYIFNKKDLNKINRSSNEENKTKLSEINSFISYFEKELISKVDKLATIKKKQELEEQKKKEAERLKQAELERQKLLEKQKREREEEARKAEIEKEKQRKLAEKTRKDITFVNNVERLQRKLNQVGCNAGFEDGVFGRQTQTAINNFIKYKRLKERHNLSKINASMAIFVQELRRSFERVCPIIKKSIKNISGQYTGKKTCPNEMTPVTLSLQYHSTNSSDMIFYKATIRLASGKTYSGFVRHYSEYKSYKGLMHFRFGNLRFPAEIKTINNSFQISSITDTLKKNKYNIRFFDLDTTIGQCSFEFAD